MAQYIVLLRGINVGGHRKIKMADLRSELEGLGFEEVKTYIQSGNIVLRSANSAEELSKKVEAMILEKFGFEVPSLVRTKAQIEAEVQFSEANKIEDLPENLVFICLIEGKPTVEAMEKLEEASKNIEPHKFSGEAFHFSLPDGARNAKISNNFFEQKLKLRASTRNLKTLRKLLDMVE